MTELEVLRWVGITGASLFLAYTAYAYQNFRKPKKEIEMTNVLKRLGMKDGEIDLYLEKGSENLQMAVTFVTFVTFVGLTLLTAGGEFPAVDFGDGTFPQPGSRVIFGMALLGAYLWGIQYIFRRFTIDDLSPSVYYRLSTRMILAPVIAMTVFNAYGTLFGGQTPNGQVTENLTIWTLVALFVGMFPQRALHWVMDRLPVFSPEADPSVTKLPLQMIQGIEMHDRMRLEEEGVNTCYDLANHDFIPLFLKTPYSARQLVDWMLQARLCEYVGGAVKDLRKHGIFRITDLKELPDVEQFAKETTVTESALKRAQKWITKHQTDLDRLDDAARRASKYLKESENVALVKQAYGTFKAREVQGLLNLYADDAKWDYPSIEGIPWSGPRVGRTEIADFFKGLGEKDEDLEFDLSDFIAQGDRVAVCYKAGNKTTGNIPDMNGVHVFEIRNGKIQSIALHLDTAGAMKAHGAGA